LLGAIRIDLRHVDHFDARVNLIELRETALASNGPTAIL